MTYVNYVSGVQLLRNQGGYNRIRIKTNMTLIYPLFLYDLPSKYCYFLPCISGNARQIRSKFVIWLYFYTIKTLCTPH